MAGRKKDAAKAATTAPAETLAAVATEAPAEATQLDSSTVAGADSEVTTDTPETPVEATAEVMSEAVEVAQEAIAYPVRLLVKNKTRMPVQVPAVGLDLPAYSEVALDCLGEREHSALLNDLAALAVLNGFDTGVFDVSCEVGQ